LATLLAAALPGFLTTLLTALPWILRLLAGLLTALPWILRLLAGLLTALLLATLLAALIGVILLLLFTHLNVLHTFPPQHKTRR
jgi:hypothetical protein